MSTSYIDEYLVKLGASVDASGMQRFYQALREASSVSDTSAKSIAGAFFKAQTEIVGGFVAIGTAAVGMVDKVAMADQQYRLFALHMYMSKDAARSLKVAMDALGEPLENLTWDKELRERTRQLVADQHAMAPDGDFDAQMKKVRDIRFEFTRMEVEGEYLAMHVVNDFLHALGIGPDELLGKLRNFNDWVNTNLPRISEKIVSIFLPVWEDLKMVFTATGHALAATSVAFTNLVGLFTGDSSIMGATFSFEKLSKAIVHIVNGFAVFATAIANVEELLAHLVSALALLATGNFSGAASELGAAFQSVTAKAVGGVIGGVGGGWAAGAAGGAALGSLFGPVGTVVGGVAGAAGGAVGGAWLGSNVADKAFGTSTTKVSNGAESQHELVEKYAAQYGISPAYAHALFGIESGEHQYNSDGSLKVNPVSSATGVTQLTKATAKALGVDSANPEQNVEGGTRLFAYYLKQYGGDVASAVAAYHEGGPKMNAILAGKATLSSEGQQEVYKVLKSLGASGSVHIGSITVNLDKPNAVNADVANAVVAKVREAQNKRTQRNLSEMQGEAWGY